MRSTPRRSAHGDDVVDELRRVPRPRRSGSVKTWQPHPAPGGGVRVGDADLDGADRRGDELARLLDHRDAQASSSPAHRATQSSGGAAPAVRAGAQLVVQAAPQRDQARGVRGPGGPQPGARNVAHPGIVPPGRTRSATRPAGSIAPGPARSTDRARQEPPGRRHRWRCPACWRCSPTPTTSRCRPAACSPGMRRPAHGRRWSPRRGRPARCGRPSWPTRHGSSVRGSRGCWATPTCACPGPRPADRGWSTRPSRTWWRTSWRTCVSCAPTSWSPTTSTAGPPATRTTGGPTR